MIYSAKMQLQARRTVPTLQSVAIAWRLARFCLFALPPVLRLDP
jgi:hypothetical protein